MNLDNYLDNYRGSKASIEERYMTRSTIGIVQKFCNQKTVLNLGLGNGLVANEISKICRHQTIVEGSEKIIHEFFHPMQNTKIENKLFENISISKTFEVVLANHVLEHVDDPVTLMRDVLSRLLSKKGILIVTVPNAESLHRRIGVQLSLLDDIYQLNSSDINAGHKRVYDLQLLKTHIQESNMYITEYGGYNIKLTSLNQMKHWDDGLLNAIFEISKTVSPEICANIWVCIKNK